MEQPPDLTVELTRPWQRPAVMLSVFVPLSLLGGFLPSFSLAANVYVLLLGGGMLVAGMSARMPRRVAPEILTEGVVWLLLPICIVIVVEAVTFSLGSTADYPTLSLLADPLLDSYLVRSAAYFGWLAVFWALARR